MNLLLFRRHLIFIYVFLGARLISLTITQLILERCSYLCFYSASSNNFLTDVYRNIFRSSLEHWRRDLYVVPKHKYRITTTRRVIYQNSAFLICFSKKVSNHANRTCFRHARSINCCAWRDFLRIECLHVKLEPGKYKMLQRQWL